MIAYLLNLLHFILVFAAVLIYFIPIKYNKYYFKFGFILMMLTPIHWIFFQNQCLFTMFTKKMGDMEDAQTNSGFSEKYLAWLYKPIMRLIGWEWNSKGIDKMVNLHWGINFILIWYYLFYVGKCKLI
mgnify:CR=1 FL=1